MRLLDSGALNQLRRRGAAVASCHPAQSFPEKGLPPQRFRGVVFGLEGDRKALAWIKPRLGRLGASMAAAMADRGFEVVGVDVRKSAVRASLTSSQADACAAWIRQTNG